MGVLRTGGGQFLALMLDVAFGLSAVGLDGLTFSQNFPYREHSKRQVWRSRRVVQQVIFMYPPQRVVSLPVVFFEEGDCKSGDAERGVSSGLWAGRKLVRGKDRIRDYLCRWRCTCC